jgi:hypothetical protein
VWCPALRLPLLLIPAVVHFEALPAVPEDFPPPAAELALCAAALCARDAKLPFSTPPVPLLFAAADWMREASDEVILLPEGAMRLVDEG